MRRLIDLIEAHHSYDELSFDTKFQPVRHGDTLRVYHGFRDLANAVELARHGLSGKVRAARVYSYESDNNPYGLFVTLSRKVAEDFVGAYGAQAIVEFNASTADLEAPVWPGGSYTVQGQYSQYFGHGAKGRLARRNRAADATKEIDQEVARDPERLDHVAQSDDRLLTYLLTNSREHQALFVGHLDPNQIAAWWVRDDYTQPWERISPEEFLDRFKDTKLSRDSRADDKLFTPNEEFRGDEFISRLRDRFGSSKEEDFFREFVRTAWGHIIESKNRVQAFQQYFEAYLWPKQYIPALKWMRAEFGR